MRSYFQVFLLFNLFGISAFAQVKKDVISKTDKAALDSMLASDAYFKMVEEDKSYFEVFAGFGNGSFSEHNKAVNATGVSNQLVITPGIAYHFKGGFSIGATGFLTKEENAGSLSLYQTGLSAAYDYSGDKVNAGISYTRYLADKNKYNSKSLYQNDIYGYVKMASGIIQPGLTLGYSNGCYKEVNNSKFRRPLIGDTILVKDSTNNKTAYFLVSPSLEHDFFLYNVLSENDELDIVPAIILNAGSDKTTITHINKLYDRLAPNSRLKKTSNENNKFQMQSLAFSFDVTYSVGKFFIQPNVYLDYYLPATNAKRLSTIYSVTAGLSF
jgi:hypothetical protein